MQMVIEFYIDKGISLLNLGCTLPKLEEICLHKSTEYKFYQFFWVIVTCLKNTVKNDRWSSVDFTRKAVANETFFWKIKKLVEINRWA